MSVLVKICGLKTPDALDAALDAGADLVGFVFFEPSPRHIASFDTARELGQRVKGRAGKVALTVDADDATFDEIVESLKPDMLQLHGKESLQRVLTLKRKFGLPVMKAIADRDANPISKRSRPMRASPTGFCSMRARRAMPRGRADLACRSTGRC